MTEGGRVEITLLGRTLTLRSAEAPEYVRSLAAYVEARVAELQRSGVRDPQTALSLAALDIADELFRMRDERRREAGDVDARLSALVALLEDVTPPRESA